MYTKTKFKCLKCGNCCRTEGYVFISETEAENIADHIGENYKTFTKKYHRRIRLSGGYDKKCIFLNQDNKCSIYKVRPKQCRSFPFWLENIKNNKNLLNLKNICNGLKLEE
ncbi:MAG: YkgJ family cysteine cluster protein [Elusimicrobiota bacterium]